MEGELYRVEQRLRALEQRTQALEGRLEQAGQALSHLIDQGVRADVNMQGVLAKLDTVLELLQPPATYPS